MEEFKNIMGDEAKKYTDKYLIQVRDEQHELINIIFEKWKQDKKEGKVK